MSDGILMGKVAVVTAAGSGMGRATAIAMAQAGASVGVADIDSDMASAVVKSITAAGGRAIAIRADAKEQRSNEAMVAQVVDAFGALHIAHLHAGGGSGTSILNADIEAFDTTIELTLRGTFLGMVAVAPEIVAAGGGSIICTSSTAALRGLSGIAGYSAAKAGLLGLVRSAAAELGPSGVRVNAICPNVVHSSIWAAKYPDVTVLDTELGGYHATRRVGRPEDVADLVVFLASDKASFITGGAHLIEGGSMAVMPSAFQDTVDSLLA